MVRADFDRNLRELQEDLMALGTMVERAIASSMEALKAHDLKLAQRVVDEDDLIDQKRYELEEKCIDLIATQQPLAIDLRMLMTMLNVTVELERVGDYAEGIAKICLMMGEEPQSLPLIDIPDIPRLAEKAAAMLRQSLGSLVNRDADAAMKTWHEDDQVDALYDQVCRELFTYMTQHPTSIKQATYLLWVAHDLERIADRATNVAERVIFLTTRKLM